MYDYEWQGTPQLVELRGWTVLNEVDMGVTRTQGVTIWQNLSLRIPSSKAALVKEAFCPYEEDNWRVLLKLHRPDRDAAWALRNATKDYLDKHP